MLHKSLRFCGFALAILGGLVALILGATLVVPLLGGLFAMVLGQPMPPSLTALGAVTLGLFLGDSAFTLILLAWLCTHPLLRWPSLIGAVLCAVLFVLTLAYWPHDDFPPLAEALKEAEIAGVYGLEPRTAADLAKAGYTDATGEIEFQPDHTFAVRHLSHRWLAIALSEGSGPVNLDGYDSFTGTWRAEPDDAGAHRLQLTFNHVSTDSAYPHEADGTLDAAKTTPVGLSAPTTHQAGYALRISMKGSTAQDLVLVKKEPATPGAK